MTIKIQTLDNIHPITIKRNISVSELKDKITEVIHFINQTFNIPVPKQRLIFQGKLLQNTEKLINYKITDQSVIHLVAKTEDQTVPNTEPQNSDNSRIEDAFSSLLEIPIIRTGRRRIRRRSIYIII